MNYFYIFFNARPTFQSTLEASSLHRTRFFWNILFILVSILWYDFLSMLPLVNRESLQVCLQYSSPISWDWSPSASNIFLYERWKIIQPSFFETRGECDPLFLESELLITAWLSEETLTTFGQSFSHLLRHGIWVLSTLNTATYPCENDVKTIWWIFLFSCLDQSASKRAPACRHKAEHHLSIDWRVLDLEILFSSDGDGAESQLCVGFLCSNCWKT